jgi:hypothetical protein
MYFKIIFVGNRGCDLNILITDFTDGKNDLQNDLTLSHIKKCEKIQNFMKN